MKSQTLKVDNCNGAISRLALGTVQFGLPYGLSNRSGQPSYETSRDILACAIDGGVTCLDTAASYGESEAVLGRALAELGVASRVCVVTKGLALPNNLSPARADSLVEESVINSLRKLRLERLPFCFFHIEENFQYADSLQKLRDRGLVAEIGCSTTTPSGTQNVIASGLADAVQFPASVLDRRFTSPAVAGDACTRGMKVFGRSVYLQGLLLLSDTSTPPDFSAVIPVRRHLADLSDAAGMSLGELALRYVIGLGDLTSILIGVEAVGQMRENIAFAEKGPLPSDLMQEVIAVVPFLSPRILDPRCWAKQMLHTNKPGKVRDVGGIVDPALF